MARLLDAWRIRSGSVFHVQHLSTERDSPLPRFLTGDQERQAPVKLNGG